MLDCTNRGAILLNRLFRVEHTARDPLKNNGCNSIIINELHPPLSGLLQPHPNPHHPDPRTLILLLAGRAQIAARGISCSGGTAILCRHPGRTPALTFQVIETTIVAVESMLVSLGDVP